MDEFRLLLLGTGIAVLVYCALMVMFALIF